MDSRDVGKLVVGGALGMTIVFVLVMLIAGIKPVSGPSAKYSEYEKILIVRAQELFLEKKAAGEDFRPGPCLADNLDVEWVADIAHQPRTPEDDLPANQCPRFLSGAAKHFVELSPTGEFLRLK